MERVRVDLRQDAAERPAARRPDPAGQRVGPPAQQEQGLLPAVARPLRDRGRRVVPGCGERADRQGQHELQRVPPPGAPSGSGTSRSQSRRQWRDSAPSAHKAAEMTQAWAAIREDRLVSGTVLSGGTVKVGASDLPEPCPLLKIARHTALKRPPHIRPHATSQANPQLAGAVIPLWTVPVPTLQAG